MRLLLTAVACLALFLPGPARGMVHFDFEQPLYSEPPQNVMDHCVVEQDGVYHLFYLRGNPAVNIGHATTTDFVHWQTQDPVVPAGTWDTRVWAPYLVQKNGSWFMYYTGVNAAAAQQSGLAMSLDLMQWFKFPNAVHHPDPAWAVWDANTFCHGRDPHVIELNGTYYMFLTAQHDWYKGAVACATSTDLINWTDAGFIYMHSNWHMLESVYILPRNGLFHMFFTEETLAGTSHMSSPTLFGGWNIANRIFLDPGHAAQVTETTSGQIFSRHAVYNDNHGNLTYTLRFTPMTWSGDTPAVPRPIPLQGTWTFVQGDAFFYQPTHANNAYARNDIYETSHVGNSWINTFELYTGPLGYGTPGQQQGDARTGIIRSPAFQIEGNSMNLLVGGGNNLDQCYVALVDAQTGEVLRRETGRDSNVMDRRYWDLMPFSGRVAYIEIADLSTGTFGHICVDDIIESGARLTNGEGQGSGKKTRGGPQVSANAAPAEARLLANTPNPFNPRTQVRFELPAESRVRVEMFDARGALVRTLLDDVRGAGQHAIEWDGTDRLGAGVASGVYFARLQVNGALVETRKMMLLK